MSEMTPGDLFRQGRLADASEAATRAVRQDASDPVRRLMLAELLLFSGEFERADAAMAAVEAVEPGAALTVAEFRQLLRAAQTRREVLRQGRAPEFLGEPTACQASILRALLALRDGDGAAAAEAAAAAEDARPAVPGVAGGLRFEDWRDADDLHAGSVEVLTTTGRYFWIPAERIVGMEFHPPRRPRDLFWRRCSMIVRDGPDGDVYIPALYDSPTQDENVRLGRGTAWSDGPLVTGVGQRTYLLGDEGVEVGRIEALEFP